MKNFLKLCIAFALIISIFIPMSAPVKAAAETYSATVNTDILNVRSGPSTKYKKVGSLKKGAKVTVYAKTKSGWSEIRYKKKKAYVSTKYLKFASSKKKISYLRDKSKVYVYKNDNEIHSLKYSGKYNGWNQWNIYKGKIKQYSILEKEDSKGYYLGYPESEYYTDIKYPIKVGKSWGTGFEGDETRLKITSTTKTVKTRAGTFKKVVEVTNNNGYRSYYAPKIGLIKTTYKGSIKSQLIELKKK